MLDSITIKIDGEEFQIKKSYRALMMFEELSGKSIDQMKESVSDLLLLFYAILKANNKEKFNKTFDEFIDFIEEAPDTVEVFNNYLIDEAKKIEKTATKKKQKNQ